MFTNVFYSKRATALATWLGIGTAFFALLSWLTPEWFGQLSVSQALLIGLALALAASLAIAVALFIFALGFRRLRPLPARPSASGTPLGDDVARLTDRLTRAEERLDGGQVVAGALDARRKPKALRLSRAEQERVTEKLIKLDDYLTGDLAREIQPFIDLMDWSEFLRFNGGAALHEKVEAPRVGLPDRIRGVAQKLKVFDEETAVLNLRPLYIKTRMLPLEGSLFDMSCVSDMLPADSINNAPLRLPGGNYNQVVTELKDEIERVRRETADWRRKIAEGQLD